MVGDYSGAALAHHALLQRAPHAVGEVQAAEGAVGQFASGANDEGISCKPRCVHTSQTATTGHSPACTGCRNFTCASDNIGPSPLVVKNSKCCG